MHLPCDLSNKKRTICSDCRTLFPFQFPLFLPHFLPKDYLLRIILKRFVTGCKFDLSLFVTHIKYMKYKMF